MINNDNLFRNFNINTTQQQKPITPSAVVPYQKTQAITKAEEPKKKSLKENIEFFALCAATLVTSTLLFAGVEIGAKTIDKQIHKIIKCEPYILSRIPYAIYWSIFKRDPSDKIMTFKEFIGTAKKAIKK